MSDKPEHPMAKRLYREFRAGSQIMKKDDAWNIANELDKQYAYILELQAEVVTLRRSGATLVKQVMGAKESLTRVPT
jgi:hypothetical protein